MHVDPVRWPFTSVFINTWLKQQAAQAARAPTLVWAYGAAMDRQERINPFTVWTGEHV